MFSNYKGIPMRQKHIDLINQGKKTTTLRDLKYPDYPFKKTILMIPEDLTDEIAKLEGYDNVYELMAELKSLGHRNFPKQMFLYYLDKPLEGLNDFPSEA